MRIGSIVIHCNNFEAMMRFWQAALGYEPREPPSGGWVVLRDPNGPNVNISLQRVPERRVDSTWIHLDLYTEDQPAEVERLLALGATRPPRVHRPGQDFFVLADPDGNLFCVVQKPPAR
jgi:catechol 2,3-dioxygenase-like lactoylglutathione lyase family enzyme